MLAQATPGPNARPAKRADADAEKQVAEQVRLIQMQRQRGHGAPPFAAAAGSRIQRARVQPIRTECLNAVQIRDEQQDRCENDRPDACAREQHEGLRRALHDAALERVARQSSRAAAAAAGATRSTNSPSSQTESYATPFRLEHQSRLGARPA